jgi:hypothetical protein
MAQPWRVTRRQDLEPRVRDQITSRLGDFDRTDGLVIAPHQQRAGGDASQLIGLYAERSPESEGRDGRPQLCEN